MGHLEYRIMNQAVTNNIFEVQLRCFEIVEELKGLGPMDGRRTYVSHHDVLMILLSRYRVHSLQQLGILDAVHIPILSYLTDINHRVLLRDFHHQLLVT